MNTDLSVFTQLKADISNFVAPAMSIKVTDFDSANKAVEAGKTIKGFLNQIEKKRKEMTAPLDAQKKAIMDYARDIAESLGAAEVSVKSQLVAFELEQEKIRVARQRVIDDERRRIEEEERQRAAQALAELEEKSKLSDRAASIFGSDPEEENTAAIEKETLVAQIAIDTQVRKVEHQQKTWDNERQGISNARKTWKCDLVDINLVPKEFLTITLNNALVLSAARNGVTDIPGVKIYQETTIAFGANTRVPREMLGR